MARKYKKKKSYEKYVIIGFILVILLLAILLGSVKNTPEEEVAVIDRSEEEIEEVEESNLKRQLEGMEERDRMEYYFGIFMEYIERGDYEKAYNLLYPEFRENYFPDVQKFTDYMQKTFTEMADVEHDNIERNGDVYVLWITINDAIDGKPGERPLDEHRHPGKRLQRFLAIVQRNIDRGLNGGATLNVGNRVGAGLALPAL